MLVRKALPRLQQPFRHYPSGPSQASRAYSTTQLNNGITLAYDLHEPPKKSDGGLREIRENAPPIIFLHGLFGSKKNNRSISKYAFRCSIHPMEHLY
jgi:pimeloyl-ACP methyl ester carboxylesterase